MNSKNSDVKRYGVISSLLLISLFSFGQAQPTEPDKSPMDMSYSPNAYPILKFQDKNTPSKPNARVVYSRPQVNGREIFGGDVVKYNAVWRLGANESTEIEFYKNAVFGDKKVVKGRYTMYCIPTPETWTLILNRGTDTWGSFSYADSLDVLRTTVSVQKIDTPVEYLTMFFDAANNLVVMWSDMKAIIPVQFAAK